MKRKAVPSYSKVMVDLETLGKRAGCKILSIGAVEFSADGLGRRLYTVVGQAGQESLHTDASTLAWWDQQSAEAREVLDCHLSCDTSLEEALMLLNAFLAPIGKGTVQVFGNGSDFDNAILYAAFAAAGMEQGWEFWNSRCFRTLKNLVPHVKAGVRTGAHNALADAEFQAEHASRIFKLAKDSGVFL